MPNTIPINDLFEKCLSDLQSLRYEFITYHKQLDDLVDTLTSYFRARGIGDLKNVVVSPEHMHIRESFEETYKGPKNAEHIPLQKLPPQLPDWFH